MYWISNSQGPGRVTCSAWSLADQGTDSSWAILWERLFSYITSRLKRREIGLGEVFGIRLSFPFEWYLKTWRPHKPSRRHLDSLVGGEVHATRRLLVFSSRIHVRVHIQVHPRRIRKQKFENLMYEPAAPAVSQSLFYYSWSHILFIATNRVSSNSRSDSKRTLESDCEFLICSCRRRWSLICKDPEMSRPSTAQL